MSLTVIVSTIICLVLIIVLSGVEYAYLASNKLTIELKRKQGSTAGKLLGEFFDFPERFWTGTVVGFYVLMVCFTFLLNYIIHYLTGDLLPNAVQLLLDIFLNSLVILVVIGFIAKKSFEFHPEGKLNTWSAFINFVNSITQPFARIFTGISEFMLKYLFNVRINKKEAIFERINTRKFFRQSVQGHENMDEANKELFEKALQLTKVRVRKCMTPRNETTAIDINAPVADLKHLFIDTKLSKIVIYEKNLDNVQGYAHHLDLNRKTTHIRDILYPIPTVPETMSAIDLIHLFTKERKSIAWVVDEFGGTAGFITMEDILEEIFGDINDEYDIERFTEKQVSAQEYIFAGRLEIDYLNAKYDFDIPAKEAETLSGFIISQHETIPKLKERIIIDNFEFEILLVTETRIETVMMKILHH